MSNRDAGVRAGRAALLDLLAELLLHELEEPTASVLAGDPALSALLEPPRDDHALGELRAEYTRLFLIEVPPYASVYLDAPPVVGGEASLRWERFVAAHRLMPASLERAAAADHAGLYLRALAAAERGDVAGPVLREALRWLPLYFTAVRRHNEAGFYSRVADVAAHTLEKCARPTRVDVDLEPEEEPPEPEDEGLREIARWLATPAWSGWFLSKRALRRLAEPFAASLGMVDRGQMLEQVFEGSALDERTAELLDALLEEWRHWQAALEAWRQGLGIWAPALDGWSVRLERTRERLRAMRAALASPA